MELLKRMESYREFYRSSQHGLKVVTSFPDGSEAADLRTYDFTEMREHRRYWDRLIQNAFRAIENHEGVEDDWIPGITLHYGFGAFGGIFCDESLVFTQDTSYIPHQVMEDWKSADQFTYRKDRFWSEVFLRAAEYISEKSKGEFLCEVYPTPSPMDVVNLLRGNDLFTDIYEYPAELTRFLEKTVDGIVEHTLNLRMAGQHPAGGVFTFDKYIPDGILLLEDAADLCSSNTYLKFGKPYTQQVVDRLGGAYIHHHSLGRQQFKNIDRIQGLIVHQISSDPNCVRPISDLNFLSEQVSGQTVLDLECTVEEIQKYAAQLSEARYILTVDCKDKDEAQWTVEFVRRQA